MRTIALDSAGRRKGKGDTRRMLDDIHPIEDSFLSLSDRIINILERFRASPLKIISHYQSTLFRAECVATIGTSGVTAVLCN